MIPSIETIVEDLAACRITKQQAIAWLHQHAQGAADELRDYFAGKALQGVMTNPEVRVKHAPQIAADVYLMADAMLAERTK